MSDDQNIDPYYPDPAFEPIRQRVDIQVGSTVQHGEAIYRIEQVLDFDSVIAVDIQSGRSAPLRIRELRPVIHVDERHIELNEIADEDWAEAEKRYSAIQPLLDMSYLHKADVATPDKYLLQGKQMKLFLTLVGRYQTTLYLLGT